MQEFIKTLEANWVYVFIGSLVMFAIVLTGLVMAILAKPRREPITGSKGIEFVTVAPVVKTEGKRVKKEPKIEPNTEIEDEVLGTVYEYIDWGDKPPG